MQFIMYREIAAFSDIYMEPINKIHTYFNVKLGSTYINHCALNVEVKIL
jgi:hypothetical protein